MWITGGIPGGTLTRPELLNRRYRRTRPELSTSRFEYLEIFHNRQRRNSALEMLTPIQCELSQPPVA